MARQFSGRTPLGAHLNEMGSKQEGLRIQQIRYRTGTIVAFATDKTTEDNKKQVLARTVDPARDGLYRFIIRMDDGKETGFLPLVGKANDHAMLKGHPSDLIGERCLIAFEGPSVNRGKILDIIDDYIDPLTVGAQNQLQITGAAFAPPGSGLV